MTTAFHFTFEKDWRHAPLAFWVHLPAPGSTGTFEPPAPREIPHKGYAVLRVQFEKHELQFSAPEQLDHFIQILSSRPLPTTQQLSSRRGLPVGPNGHWLSRLPAALKAPKKRAKLVEALRAVRETVAGAGLAPSFKLPDSLFS
jgi:hypothetical protein